MYKKDCKKAWQRRGQETSYILEWGLAFRDFIMVNLIFLCSNIDDKKFGIFSFIFYLRF